MCIAWNPRCVLSPASNAALDCLGVWYAAMVWNQDEKLESERGTMSEESNLDLEQLTKRVAEQIIFVVGSATVDPKAAVIALLRQYLADAEAQAYEEAVREQELEERDQQN